MTLEGQPRTERTDIAKAESLALALELAEICLAVSELQDSVRNRVES